MSATWYGDASPPDPTPISFLGWLRVIATGVPLAVLVFGGLLVLLLVRVIEAPVFGARRPVTPYITVIVCRGALWLLGIKRRVFGPTASAANCVVANHSSWLDIFVLNATGPVYFVSKAEVASWPGIGWLARGTGTMFVKRDRAKAAGQTEQFLKRLEAGHKLLFFPEGTSSDGLRVLPFKSTLFAAFASPGSQNTLSIQPVTVVYSAPCHRDARFFGWWGDMDFGGHLLQVLAHGRGGRATMVQHAALRARDYPDRKALARACEERVRAGRA
ncbi:MAG: lysophospholipid acyltransferase family protein [Pseudomonadota bacterium]